MRTSSKSVLARLLETDNSWARTEAQGPTLVLNLQRSLR